VKGWNYYETDITRVVETNLITFFDWNFIDRGAIVNINIPQSGAYGGDFSQLRPSQDPRYTTGTIWESIRGNWVWESGLSLLTPIKISGVFVDNVLNTNNTIDYIRGRVIFDTAISTSSTVRLEYSYKEVQFDHADNHPWIRQIQQRSRRIDDSNFYLSSGNYNLLPDNRIQLPYVGIHAYGRKNKGYQLGGSHWVEHTCKFHIIAEDDYTCRKISDMIANQENTTFYVFSPDLMISSSAFPLNIDGTLASNPLCYPDIIKPTGDGGFRYLNGIQNGKAYMFNCQGSQIQDLGGAYYTTVTLNTELIATKL